MKDSEVRPEQICFLRGGSKHGVKHMRLNFNNQDAFTFQTFEIPAFSKSYNVGLVSDGCSGQPSFSHNEVGAHLVVLYAYRRIQELVCAGLPIAQIPQVLYPSITEFLLDVMTKVMPPNIVWRYPVKLKGREDWGGQTRFKTDYLAATLIGFVSDGETLITFSAGDGIILVDDELVIVDQNDTPDYPAVSVNRTGSGFASKSYRFGDLKRVAIATDGLKFLISDLAFRAELFQANAGKAMGLQTFLATTALSKPELMQDDCTAVTLEIGKRKE
jgi:hypothetical protein